jgi:hypothetical protein
VDDINSLIGKTCQAMTGERFRIENVNNYPILVCVSLVDHNVNWFAHHDVKVDK